jgi:hypothetical protein
VVAVRLGGAGSEKTGAGIFAPVEFILKIATWAPAYPISKIGFSHPGWWRKRKSDNSKYRNRRCGGLLPLSSNYKRTPAEITDIEDIGVWLNLQ